MNGVNLGHVNPLFRRVGLGGSRGRLLRDRVRLVLINQTLRSRDQSFGLDLSGRMVDVPTLQVPAQPNGLYQAFVSPKRYRSKSVFLNVSSGRRKRWEMEFFIRASQARYRFPSFRTLGTRGEWAALFGVFQASQIGHQKYSSLSPEEKGTLFNIHAKTQDQLVSAEKNVFSFFRRIVRIERDRVFLRVSPALERKVQEFAKGFHSVPGTLHRGFSPGYERTNSFKTHERVGNLQLTFAQNAEGEFEVDADLDDHQGIRHAFDVLRHKLTGGDTHPFNIHQVLLRFHNIDPGYDLF